MVNDDKLIFQVSLSRLTFLNVAEKIILFKKLDNYNDFALLSIVDIGKIVSRDIRANWDGKENLRQAKNEVRIMQAKGIKSVFYEDADYPALLKETSNAPFMLFYYGDITSLHEKTVSVVGTRRVIPQSKRAAFQFAYDAVMDGCTVVSGLANGIDGSSHEGAVSALFDKMEKSEDVTHLGKTVAVLPCGIDTITPSNHKKLATNIIKTGGCVLSEYTPGTPAENWRFVQRNRIIAALSPATVSIQSPCGSGALITVQYAIEYNRDVMFHEVNFLENALKIDDISKKRLEKDFAAGKVAKSKLESRVQKYVADGAAVIKDYADYCKCRVSRPGDYSEKSEKYLFRC